MRWMEQAAYIAASRVGRGGRHLLTASMDSIAFRHPTRVGDILYVSAQVFCHFNILCDSISVFFVITPMSIKSVPPASAVAPACCPYLVGPTCFPGCHSLSLVPPAVAVRCWACRCWRSRLAKKHSFALGRMTASVQTHLRRAV